MKRTNTCGELSLKDVNKKVILQGWINKIRKMGGLTFIDLRDRYGITQLVLNEDVIQHDIKSEYVIEVIGKVIERKSKNQNIKTGDIEIDVEKIFVINKSELTPFEMKDEITAQEDTRLKYRYLDLRRPVIQKNLIFRSKLNNIIRNFFVENNFIEVETPVFGKSTPEGARDFLVPSRLNKNKFYALPQSPQLYKQLLMISGLDRYFQIVKCFRDEDLRVDRQPEFTQLDMEMSFANQEDVIQIIENLIAKILKETKNVEIKKPFLRLPYDEAIEKYGSDKPDLRYNLEIKTLNSIFENTELPLFKNALQAKNTIRAICVNTLLTKKELELLTETLKQNNVSILAFAKIENDEWTGSVGSKLNEYEKKSLNNLFNIKDRSTILFACEDYIKVSQAMGAVRKELATILHLADSDTYKLLWVTDFPLFEYSEEESRYVAAHHPFTMPQEKYLKDFDTNKKEAKANAYDIVMNGFEIGGGSQRITNPVIQQRMFDAIELTKEQVEANFGWFVEAYKYGAPYHSGCALGLDRICMLLCGTDNIREVMAFPKNSSGIDPMSNAPDFVSEKQLDELSICLKK